MIRETIIEITQRREANIFLIDATTGREITYGEFHWLARALAAELSVRGVKKGDRIAIMLPNCIDLAVLYFACIYIGAVIVPINPALSKSDAQFIVSNCKPKMVVTGESCASLLKDSQPNVVTLATRKEMNSALDASAIHIHELADAREFLPLEAADADDLIAIMYTSGTSSKPKGLAHRLGSMLRNATAFADAQGLDQNSRFYLTLSMAYMGGFYNLLILPFLCGASVVVDHVFDARSSLQFWEKAKNNSVNTLWLAPTILSILLRMDRGRTGEEFCRNSVRHAFVGFAPLPLRVKNEFEARYRVRLIENYGLSETLFVTARSQNILSGQGYVGEVLPGVAVRIVDDRGHQLPSGAEGEVQILTPDLMAGYLEGDSQLIRADSSSWFATGDIARFDASDSLFITGRKKDLIIRGGVNISPAAIEEALMQVDGVSEVAVVSIPHELYGEDIIAVLKLNPGIELESILDSLIAHARSDLAQHQQPARYITIDEFPKTTNGKVQKSRIRELVAEKLQVSAVAPMRSRATETVAVSS
jgi:long-chain acyl-CoA synthetase